MSYALCHQIPSSDSTFDVGRSMFDVQRSFLIAPQSAIRNRMIPHSPSGLFCAPFDRTSKMFVN
jgi:hypothetical protein